MKTETIKKILQLPPYCTLSLNHIYAFHRRLNKIRNTTKFDYQSLIGIFVEHKTLREVGQQLQLSGGRVRQLAERARQRLIDMMLMKYKY